MYIASYDDDNDEEEDEEDNNHETTYASTNANCMYSTT